MVNMVYGKLKYTVLKINTMNQWKYLQINATEISTHLNALVYFWADLLSLPIY